MNNVSKAVVCLLVSAVLVMPISAVKDKASHVEADVEIYDVSNEHVNTATSGGWIKHFEGTSWGHSVIQTSDGGYLVAGGTGYNDGSDALLLKTDAEGNKRWETTFGESFGWDAFEGLVETGDGGFVASGTKAAKGFLAKVDAHGNQLWEKTYGGSTNGYCIDVRQTPDGGFILAGLYYAEPRKGWLIRTDSEGIELWSKTYGGDYPVTFHSVRCTDDGGFFISGWDEGSNILEMISWAVKTDAQGKVEWSKFYDSCYNFHSGMPTSDGGYIGTGALVVVSTLNFCQIALVKTDFDGTEVWSKNFGVPFLIVDNSFWVEETSDGGYVIIGLYGGTGTILNLIQTNHMFPLNSQIWMIKTDANGNLEWDNKVETGLGRCVKQAADGGYILTGQRGAYNNPEGILLIKTDENGDI